MPMRSYGSEAERHVSNPEEAARESRDRTWFEHQVRSTSEFWNRIGLDLDVAQAHVLDLGCGLGALSVELAQRGAQSVLGLDIDPHSVAFARKFVPSTYASLGSRIQFVCDDIATLPGEQEFDFVFSKDAFEHILDLTGVVSHIHRLLKPGGRLVIGTSPLYFSPFGDHEIFSRPRIPWLTAIVPDNILFRFAGWKHNLDLRTASDAGLNKMTPAQFRLLFPSSSWQTESIRYNAGAPGPAASVMDRLRKIPLIEKYFTVSIYSVMVRR
jgi:2-polyprenyl-3-methyl-5-hydroxy-6-metoxy-1,4-benzoquinol methylase